MLFGESSLAPSPGLPKAGRANTLLRASCLKPLCPHSAHPDCSARPHSAVSCHLYTHLHSMCLHVPAASPRGPTSRGYAGASLGSDGQVHSWRLSPVVDVPGIFPGILPQWLAAIAHFWIVAHSLKNSCLKRALWRPNKKGGGKVIKLLL